MFGLRGEYRFNENFTLGATYMRLFERPFTQKVNIGEDPINNRMFGLDLNMTTDAPGITKLVDRLPIISTDAPSSFTVSAEVAALKPGHSGAINSPGEDKGVVSLDDFEGANSGIPLGSRPNLWALASPTGIERLRDQKFSNNTFSGANRALLNWYVVDDRRLAGSNSQQNNPYTRRFRQDDLFEREIDASQIPDLRTFDISYYPSERGPYNFDLPDGINGGLDADNLPNITAGVEEVNGRLKLKAPETRWGGIMRYLPNNDFEATNYEYIEFWMLNPFMDTEDVEHDPNENGSVKFHLGNISEDILRDDLQFYENAIETGDDKVPTRATAWGDVPLSIPNVKGFDREFQEDQDLGLDGLSDERERTKHADYVTAIENLLRSTLNDPANDNYVAYLDESFPDDASLLDRYRRFNHPQGNAPTQNQRIGLGNPVPDSEDLNDNRSLETNESFYEYDFRLLNNNGEIDKAAAKYITDERITTNPGTNQEEKWYRFQIPIFEGKAFGGIEGFRSIQFMRLVMSEFKTPKTLRLAEFELVRNQWRRLVVDEQCDPTEFPTIQFVVDEVGIQENSERVPFNYVRPKGIKEERIFSTFSNILQDENSLALRTREFPDQCEFLISKLTRLDVRQFERLQMFVHAERSDLDIEDKAMSLFVRIGKDYTNNYYEYEVPLVFSDPDAAALIDPSMLEEYADEVWREENKIDFPLSFFTETKIKRNNEGASIQDDLLSRTYWKI